MTEAEFRRKLWQLNRLGYLALVGVFLIGAGCIARNDRGEPEMVSTFFGVLLLLPAMAYLVMLTVWHWKGRYRGSHSDLWGALLVVEVSGWSKIVYLFRHLLSDARRTGRYAESESSDEV